MEWKIFRSAVCMLMRLSTKIYTFFKSEEGEELKFMQIPFPLLRLDSVLLPSKSWKTLQFYTLTRP